MCRTDPAQDWRLVHVQRACVAQQQSHRSVVGSALFGLPVHLHQSVVLVRRTDSKQHRQHEGAAGFDVA